MLGWITRAYCRPACSRQAFVAITDPPGQRTGGKTHDLSAARALGLPKGSIVVMDRGYTDCARRSGIVVRRSIVVMDRGYTDYTWYNSLNNNGISSVTRLKTNARYRVIASAGSATVSAERCSKPKV